MILEDILTHKRREIETAQARLSLDELTQRVRAHPGRHRFRDALRDADKRPALIAELKRQSPSRGMLRERFDPVRLGQELQEAGAASLSILTDERFFGGSLEILRDVQSFVEIPVLRKDFIIDPYQIYEAAAHQADAVLLITQILSDDQLTDALKVAEHVGLDALVEVHTDEELDRAVRAHAQLIGLNSRDLRTFTMHPDIIARLVPRIPPGTLIIAESGIQTREDVQRLTSLGVHALLIGESLMTAPDPAAKVRELFTGVW
ncbi:MAG: indole-3-glycerol phosphate synthase TrpC [Candidatus Omnitrophica bacterium]|nr:indole-3-glycerol phosphate synthase TrpC [Candidatus Omnitrophota bacterium]